MKKAKFIKDVDEWKGEAKLYKVNPPMKEWDEEGKEFDYVIVSAVVAPFTGPETYIFGCDESGENVDYGELEGSYRGGLDHVKALKNAGYEL